MYACHLDGNSFNNVLSNLVWNKSPNSYRIYSTPGTPIIITHQEYGVFRFESQKQCLQYLNSANIKISSTHLNTCIRTGKKYQGYSFTYCDEDLYSTSVTDLANEQWKECDQSTRSRYLVSNFGRIKSIAKNGKERLRKLSCIHGYPMFSLTFDRRTNYKYVHQMVAHCFVPNPNNYGVLDHKDTNKLNNHATNLRWVKDSKANANNPKTKSKLQNKQSIKQIDK
eukprot:503909_1